MATGKKRPIAHIRGEQGVSILKSYFPDSWVVREYSPDYGIDLSVELFKECGDGFVTSGEHIFFQVKTTDTLHKRILKVESRMNVEKEYRTTDREILEIEVVKYSIDTDLLSTVEKMGSSVPVILSIIDGATRDAYFVCLNDYIEKIIITEKFNYSTQASKTIYIPINNKINEEGGIKIIEWYAKRPKLYALFNKINYQKRELQYCDQYNIVRQITHFLRILMRSDAWSAADYFGAMSVVKRSIDFYLEHGITQEAERAINDHIASGKNVDEKIWEATYCSGLVSLREAEQVQALQNLWNELCLMGDIFEDVTKEAFLPTILGVEINA